MFELAKKKTKSGMFEGAGAKSLMSKLGKVAYGYVREMASNAISNTAIVKRLPATEFTDEAVMLAAMFGARKLGFAKGILGSIVRAGETVELARIGQTIKDIQTGRSSTSSGDSSPAGLLF